MFDLITLLLLFMIIASVIALFTNDLLSAVIALGAVGFGSTVLFLLLKAPDVVPTHIVVEVLTLIILIRAVVGRETVAFTGVRAIPVAAASGVLVLIFLTFAVMSFSGMPKFGTPSMVTNLDAPSRTYIAEGLKETGAANAVTGVLLDYRAYDTLGEATVLFTAIIGAVVLLRRRSRRKRQGQPDNEQGGNEK